MAEFPEECAFVWFGPDDTDCTERAARQRLPPGTNLYKDYSGAGSWLACYKDFGGRRRPWGLGRGKIESLEMIAKWLWRNALVDELWVSVLDCPVEGLFGARTGKFKEDDHLEQMALANIID